MPFSEVAGHDRLKSFLRRVLQRGRLPHAVLLSGPEGVGKKLLAVECCTALLCESPSEAESCGVCRSCSRASRGLHPDLSIVKPATPNAIRIDQVREMVRGVQARPFEGRARGFVVDEAHLLTEEAQNALLKSLEEPPPTSRIFLVTAAPLGLLPTIRSRCQELRATALPTAEVESFLVRRGIPAPQARLRALLAAGSIGLALALDSETYVRVREDAVRALDVAVAGDDSASLEAAERLAEAEDPVLALTILRSLLRDVHALGAGATAERLVNADLVDRLRPLSGGPLGVRARGLAEAVGQTRTLVKGNANRLLAFDELIDQLGT